MHFLTSIRGIASLIVVLFHIREHLLNISFLQSSYWIYGNGYLGVDLFFILSGFILTYKYSEEFKYSFKGFTSFIKKRIARIYPLHFCVMFFYLIIPLALVITQRQVPVSLYSTEGFFKKILLIDLWGLNNTTWNTWNIPSWSISAEFVAYLVFPFIVFFFQKLHYTAKILMFFGLPMVLGLIFDFFPSENIGSNIGNLGLLRCLIEFSMGCLIFLIIKRLHTYKSKLSFLLICVIVTLSAILNFDRNYFYIPYIFSLLLIALIIFPSYPLVKLLSVPPLMHLGNISYSIYLTHTLVRDILFMITLKGNEVASINIIIIYITITIFISSITYKYIEIPMRRRLKRTLLN